MDDYTSPARLVDPNSDPNKLRIRQETHRLYTEPLLSVLEWVTELMDIRPRITITFPRTSPFRIEDVERVLPNVTSHELVLISGGRFWCR